MPTRFDLIVTADDPSHSAELRLLDADGVQLAYRRTDFKTIRLSHRRGLFDLRNYLRLYLLVRVVHAMQAPASAPLELAPGEALRVLFVFAEARGSRPLGARQERRDLLRLFQQDVYPQRRVVAHFLTHGVTRERLVDQIRQRWRRAAARSCIRATRACTGSAS